MNYNDLVQELSSPKPVFENGELIQHKPPSSLEMRAARAIQTLVNVVVGLEKSIKNESHFDQRPSPGSGDLDLRPDEVTEVPEV
jgi:hypothetical protein